MNVQGKQFGGEAVFTGHMDGDFVAEVQVRLNSGKDASLYFRYLDPDHWYRARLQGTAVGAVFLKAAQQVGRLNVARSFLVYDFWTARAPPGAAGEPLRFGVSGNWMVGALRLQGWLCWSCGASCFRPI
ncbi:MAG: hypothetical protein F9K13_13785 [Candidatus Methylomirabilis oxygeniifera]|nr:MAG: hypothetical protein F9K13_13785 [Candidatus Methylomirabilis oxyfera]